MENLNNIDFTTPRQKIIAGVGLSLLAVGAYFLLPPLIEIFTNIYIAGALGLGLVFVGLNYNNIWESAKQITWKITKNRIASDKIYYMWRYYDFIVSQREKLEGSIINVSSIASKIDRKLADVITRHKENKAKAELLEKQGKSQLVISTAYERLKIDQDSIDVLGPQLEGIRQQEKYLQDLSEAWGADIEKLKYRLEAKEEEFVLLKELAAATNNASEFLKGNSKEAKQFDESLKQIENSCNMYIGTITNFQRRINPMMENLAANREVDVNAGKALLEEYKKERVDFLLEK